jgi:hypothetical protein
MAACVLVSILTILTYQLVGEERRRNRRRRSP